MKHRLLLSLVLLLALLASITSPIAATRPIAYVPTTAGVMLGNGTSTVTGVAPSTTGNALVSNGSTWVSAAISGSGVNYGAFASRPASPTPGMLYYPTDGYAPAIYTSEWQPLINGSVMGYEPPTVSGWTTYSYGGISGAQVPTNSAGWIKNTYNNYNGTAEEVRITTHAMSSTTLTITAWVRLFNFNTSGTQILGIVFRDSSNGSIESWALESQTNVSAMYIARHRATASNTTTSPTYFFDSEVNPTGIYLHPAAASVGLWLRMTHNSSGDRKFYVSEDGINFQTASNLDVTANAFMTANQVGVTAWVSSAAANCCGTLGGYIGSYKEN